MRLPMLPTKTVRLVRKMRIHPLRPARPAPMTPHVVNIALQHPLLVQLGQLAQRKLQIPNQRVAPRP